MKGKDWLVGAGVFLAMVIGIAVLTIALEMLGLAR